MVTVVISLRLRYRAPNLGLFGQNRILNPHPWGRGPFLVEETFPPSQTTWFFTVHFADVEAEESTADDVLTTVSSI